METEKRRSRSIFLAATLSMFLYGGCGNGEVGAPNFIVISVDALRFDSLGFNGFPGEVSPNIDRLASQSLVFRNCFVQAPWTKPSVASLFTSLYPQVHRLTNHEGEFWGGSAQELKTGVLTEEAVTWAEALRANGYATAAFVSNPWIVRPYGFAQGFDFYDDHIVGLAIPANRLTENARAWIATRAKDTPFFVYLHLMDVHAPYAYYSPRSDFDVLHDEKILGADRTLSDSDVPYARWQNIEKRPDWATDEMRHTLNYWRARYASGVRSMDRRLRPFFEFLETRGLFENSYLILTSDHGEEFFEHGDWSHGQNLFDHQLRVPLLIRPPGGLEKSRDVTDVVESIDLMPTTLALAGAEPGTTVQGRNIAGLLAEEDNTPERSSFATATQPNPFLYSVRTRNHHLVFDVRTENSLLFDLRTDPWEQTDVSEVQADTAEKLRNRILEHVRESTAGGTLQNLPAELPAGLLEQLKSLGYVN